MQPCTQTRNNSVTVCAPTTRGPAAREGGVAQVAGNKLNINETELCVAVPRVCTAARQGGVPGGAAQGGRVQAAVQGGKGRGGVRRDCCGPPRPGAHGVCAWVGRCLESWVGAVSCDAWSAMCICMQRRVCGCCVLRLQGDCTAHSWYAAGMISWH